MQYDDRTAIEVQNGFRRAKSDATASRKPPWDDCPEVGFAEVILRIAGQLLKRPELLPMCPFSGPQPRLMVGNRFPIKIAVRLNAWIVVCLYHAQSQHQRPRTKTLL
jgi:hypothetical protein